MIAGIILVVLGFLLFLLPPWFLKLIGLICFILGIILLLRSCKTFLFNLIDHTKGTNKVTPKRNKNAAPPWEE